MEKIFRFFFQEKLENKLNYRSTSFKLIFFLTILFTGFQFSVVKTEASFGETSLKTQNTKVFAAEQDIRELKPGETIERQAKPDEIHAYQIRLEAGTSVEITFGKRDTNPQFTALIPDKKDYTVPGNKIPAGKELARVIVGAGDVLVEPFVIVAEETGNYVITARFWNPGTYSLNCGMPRVTTERDRKYAVAGKLFSEIRQSMESGKPPWELFEKVEQRAAIYRDLDDKKSLALSLRDFAMAFQPNTEWEKSIAILKESSELFRSLNSPRDVIVNLWLIWQIALQKGDYQTSIDSSSEGLTLSRLLKDKTEEARALHDLGIVYHLLADQQKALEYYEQSLSIKKTLPFDPISGEPVTLINMGNIYRGVEGNEIVVEAFERRTNADRQKALEYYLRALEISRDYQKSNPGARTRENYLILQVGNTNKELGNNTEALKYLNQALEIANKRDPTAYKVYVLMALGNLYNRKGEYQKSGEYYEQTIELLKKGIDQGHQARYLVIIAQDYYRAGEVQKALDLNNEALSLSRTRAQQPVAAAALFEIARIERDLGNFNNARTRIEEAIQTVESLRARINSQDVRTIYFSTVKNYYDFYIDLLMQAHKSQPEKGYDALALKTSEKARSRSLLDLLTLSKIDVKQGVDPSLLEQESKIRQKLSEKANQQNRLLLGNHTKEDAEKMQGEVTNLTAEYEKVQSEIRNKSPRYAALTQPTSLDTRQIQQLLDSGTILLEYSLGEKKSYLWAVSANSVISFDLPPREEIEAQARRVYELLTARNRNLKGETDEQKRARVKTAEDEYGKAAARLSEMLLGQAASQIGNKRLLIVPDGALNYIPFAALPAPQIAGNANLPTTLGTNHEIVTLPSASILALLREENAARKPAPKMLAVFADPVFNQKDVRAGKTKPAAEVSQMNNKTEKSSFNRDFERAVSDVGLRDADGLPRLPFSRREADSIFRVSPRNLSLKETDFDASKANVFGSNLDQYRILHFATHGLLNSQHPELSGLVLSLFDKSGGEIDGFVRLQDIYNLKLSADLVVLSACQTALGKDVKGEGLISLTRGFMYAGAPRVVASLWKVDDAATAELMTIFYRKMLVENLRPAAALRAAQTDMMRQTRWKSPYYWAAFTIQGEWR